MIKISKKIINTVILIICSLSVFSCQNKKNVDDIENENEKNNIENNLTQKPKYVFVVFNVEEPKLKIEKQFTRENQDASDLEIKYKDYYYVEFEKTNYKSEIKETLNYNEDKKFKILDDFESHLNLRLILINSVFHDNLFINCKDEDLRELYRETECRIKDRQIFTYDSYSEASQARQKFKS